MPADVLVILNDWQLEMNLVSGFWLEVQDYSMIFMGSGSFDLWKQICIRVVYQHWISLGNAYSVLQKKEQEKKPATVNWIVFWKGKSK